MGNGEENKKKGRSFISVLFSALNPLSPPFPHKMSSKRKLEDAKDRGRALNTEDWQRKLVDDVPASQLPLLISDRQDLSQHVLRLYKQGRPGEFSFLSGSKRAGAKATGGGSAVSSLLEAERTLDALKRKVLEQEREMNELRAELDNLTAGAEERRAVHETYTRMMAFLEDYGLSVDLDPEGLTVRAAEEEEREKEAQCKEQGLLDFLGSIEEGRVATGEVPVEACQSEIGVKRVGLSNIHTLGDESTRAPLFRPGKDSNVMELGGPGRPLRAEEFLARIPVSVVRSSGSTLEDKRMRVVAVREPVRQFLEECTRPGAAGNSEPRRLDE